MRAAVFRREEVIQDEKKLLVASPELFRNRFNIDVHTHHEVMSINRQSQEIEVRDLKAGISEKAAPHDALLLSPGAAPLRPPLPGIDLPGVFVLRNDPQIAAESASGSIPNRRSVRLWSAAVSSGWRWPRIWRIGGLEITIIEAADQLMPPLDPEMAEFVRERLVSHNARLQLGDPVAGFEETTDGLKVTTKSGMEFSADFVILAIGVKPETDLAKSAGLEIGSRGGIRVDGIHAHI